MVIKMIRTHTIPTGTYNKDCEYDTDKILDLSVGQAKTFVLCGSAIDVTPELKKVVKNEPKKVVR